MKQHKETKEAMTPAQRVSAALQCQEPDRVPFFLLLTMHGARELGLSIGEYFSSAGHVIEGQLRMRDRYNHDCFYPFFYGAAEIEAWGGEVIFSENGPPNAGRPVIADPEAIADMMPPGVESAPVLSRILEATAGLRAAAGDDVPVIGVVISPFSLPIMQMGFEPYLILLHEQPERFRQLMAVNEQFCLQWARAQLQAGATAICYFDPMSSPTILPRQMYLETGFAIARRMISAIDAPVAAHTASGRVLPIIDDLFAAGADAVCPASEEDLADIQAVCGGRMGVIGNLNGVAMRRWSPQDAEDHVRKTISRGGAGGGLILADNHGEIPFQVPESVLEAISRAVHTHGRYPLR
ncbi:MAG: uroporphyrinogen decarboxylase family protein [Desulfosalsimonas sp.]|uniref:uroporphyrinogen decarboxylase family protein n=1 Tax=Desulfosalsimonas sp. TaxID=3073848 RepID=UPI003970E089